VRAYEFTLHLVTGVELDDKLTELIFEAGCDDCTPVSFGPKVYLEFAKVADSLEAALSEAVSLLDSVGIDVASAEVQTEALEPA